MVDPSESVLKSHLHLASEPKTIPSLKVIKELEVSALSALKKLEACKLSTVSALTALVALVTVTPAMTVFRAVPPTVIASASKVPSKSPSTASIFPTKVVALSAPEEELNVKLEPVLAPKLPLALVANKTLHPVSDD